MKALIRKGTTVIHPETGAHGVVTAINHSSISVTSLGTELVLTLTAVNELLDSGELLPKDDVAKNMYCARSAETLA